MAKKGKVMQIRISEEMLNNIKAEASKRDLSVSCLVRILISEAVKKGGRKSNAAE